MKSSIVIPADVPARSEKVYRENYEALTHVNGRLLLFAADQKIEHLNDDFYGPGIHSDANNPEHLFRIADQGSICAFATHLGLIARYGRQYPKINYLVKLNGKTNLIPTAQRDPLSPTLWTIEDVIQFKKESGLLIRGVGYTLYPGSEYESEMLKTAAHVITQAHAHGLVTVLWMYPRGKSVKNERDGALTAGVAGLAAALGSDFAKINPPDGDSKKTGAEWLAVAAQAAGNTKLICSGGKTKEPKEFLQELKEQLTTGGMMGCATGRNIHARGLQDAIAMTKSINDLIQNLK